VADRTPKRAQLVCPQRLTLNWPSIVLRARFPPMADLTARVHRRRKISAVLLATLLAATPLLVVGATRPAGADQVATLRAQAAAVS
jgi:hypothetical protein